MKFAKVMLLHVFVCPHGEGLARYCWGGNVRDARGTPNSTLQAPLHVDRQTRVKALPSQTSFAGGKNDSNLANRGRGGSGVGGVGFIVGFIQRKHNRDPLGAAGCYSWTVLKEHKIIFEQWP